MRLPPQNTPAAAAGTTQRTAGSHLKQKQRFSGSRHRNEDANTPQMAEISCTHCRYRKSKMGREKTTTFSAGLDVSVMRRISLAVRGKLLALLIKMPFWKQRPLSWPLSFLGSRTTQEVLGFNTLETGGMGVSIDAVLSQEEVGNFNEDLPFTDPRRGRLPDRHCGAWNCNRILLSRTMQQFTRLTVVLFVCASVFTWTNSSKKLRLVHLSACKLKYIWMHSLRKPMECVHLLLLLHMESHKSPITEK